MPTIKLTSCEIEFSQTLITVPVDGSDWNWTCTNWIDIPQAIEISQMQGCANVMGLTGQAPYKGEHLIVEINPRIFSLPELINYVIASAVDDFRGEEIVRPAVTVKNMVWGNVVTLSWELLGYAPGGDESYILPSKGCAVHIGFLRFDWENLTFTLLI